MPLQYAVSDNRTLCARCGFAIADTTVHLAPILSTDNTVDKISNSNESGSPMPTRFVCLVT
jgi:hypothetical protein